MTDILPGIPIVTVQRESLHFDANTKAYLNGHKLQNPAKPPDRWRYSGRYSPTSEGLRPMIALPGTLEDAVRGLQATHACGLLFDDEPVQSPFPFGEVWINLADGRDSWGVGSARVYTDAAGGGFQGLIGGLYQDGCKFHSVVGPVETVVIKRSWLSRLAEQLQALRLKSGAGRG